MNGLAMIAVHKNIEFNTEEVINEVGSKKT